MNNKVIFPNQVEVCALGLGTWNMGEDPTKKAEEIKALQRGIELGMSAIDTAEMYGSGRSEALVGEAIAGKREQVFLISKVLPSHASYHGTKQACEQSLKRLKTDRLDLYLLHWRGGYALHETVKAMIELQREGKISQWGVSNFDQDDMEELYDLGGGDGCAANEVLYNLSRRGIEYDLMPWCEKQRLPLIAYSPIEQGRILKNKTLSDIAARYHATPAQIALAWVLRRPNVLAIPKAGKIAHVEENFQSLSFDLDADDFRLLDAAFPKPTGKVPLEMI